MNDATRAKQYIVTAALPYANGLKHIGHLAGVYLPSDIYVRYLRSQKQNVIFVCGSDENGAAITLQSIKEKKHPKQIVDHYHNILKDNFAILDISFDIYHRTSATLHHETAQKFFLSLYKKGLLEEIEEEQFYDPEIKMFLADRYITGICPLCHHEEAYGDQCESCGSALSPKQLQYPKSVISKATPQLKKTSHFYLPLDKYTDFIAHWMTENEKKNWKPNVIGQCKSWIQKGLKPRAVTRDLDWGVKVPLPGSSKVLYVWFDAPIGYISATKQWAKDKGTNWKLYWHDKNTRLIHFIGKDNIIFHCIIFPIMLKLGGYILPENVPANEFMNMEGNKMSTSRGWNISMKQYIDDFVIKQGKENKTMVDCLRYYLASIMPETKDSDFVWKKFQEAINSELVGILGNFINRTWVLTHKLTKGKVPPPHQHEFNKHDIEFIYSIKKAPSKIASYLETYHFRDALQEIMNLARKANKYLQEKEPWVYTKQLKKDPTLQKSIDNTLYLCLQVSANLSIFINPFLPNTAHKMRNMMKVVPRILDWENAGRTDLLKVGYSIRPPELLFQRVEDDMIIEQEKKPQEEDQ